MTRRAVEVHVDRAGTPVHVADLTFETNAGGALVATEVRYQREWLDDPRAYELSPELPLTSGVATFAGRTLLPGAIGRDVMRPPMR